MCWLQCTCEQGLGQLLWDNSWQQAKRNGWTGKRSPTHSTHSTANIISTQQLQSIRKVNMSLMEMPTSASPLFHQHICPTPQSRNTHTAMSRSQRGQDRHLGCLCQLAANRAAQHTNVSPLTSKSGRGAKAMHRSMFVCVPLPPCCKQRGV